MTKKQMLFDKKTDLAHFFIWLEKKLTRYEYKNNQHINTILLFGQ